MSEKRELPKGWIWAKIGEICRSDKRIIPPKSEEWKKLPYVGLANIASDTGKIVDVLPTNKPNCVSFHFSNRHILFSKLRPYLNKVALPNFERNLLNGSDSVDAETKFGKSGVSGVFHSPLPSCRRINARFNRVAATACADEKII